MKRTPIDQRQLPAYTTGEERFHCLSHMLGAIFGVLALTLCLDKAKAGETVPCLIYGLSMILLYSMSALYHGLPKGRTKKIMQVIDHCTIYALIGGTYTPIAAIALRRISPTAATIVLATMWGLAVIATVFTAIDLKKYSALSMTCYIGMGWCIVCVWKKAVEALTPYGMAWLLAGGILYTIGAVLYGIGKKKRYMHGVFHVFVLAGSVCQFVGVHGWAV